MKRVGYYRAVVLDALGPEARRGELATDDDSDAEHERHTHTDDSARHVISW